MIPERAAALGRSAVQATETGVYQDSAGRAVYWREAVAASLAGKRSIPPDAPLPEAPSARFPQTRVEVANETTLVAAKRLSETGERGAGAELRQRCPSRRRLPQRGARPGGDALSLERAVGALARRSDV